MPDKESNTPQRGQSLIKVLKSTASSMLGVQSKKNHEEDFAKGKLSHYIIAGIVGTIFFILIVLGVVMLVSSLVIPPQ